MRMNIARKISHRIIYGPSLKRRKHAGGENKNSRRAVVLSDRFRPNPEYDFLTDFTLHFSHDFHKNRFLRQAVKKSSF